MFIGLPTFAQFISNEKTHEITKKAARRGELGNVVVDDTRQQLDLVFITKSTNKKIKFQAYQFDYDLNLLGEIEDEQEIEKARGKYNWFGDLFKEKEEYTITGISAQANLAGTAVFKKKETKYSFNWLKLAYDKKTKVLETLKPKSDYGKKMYFRGSFDLDQEGESMAFIAYKPEKVKDFNVPFINYGIMRVNQNLDVLSEEKINFETAHYPIWNGPINTAESGKEEAWEWGMIFAPTKDAYSKKVQHPTANEYTYIRINREGKIVDRIQFMSKAYFWKVDAMYQAPDGSVYAYGPGKNKGIEKAFMKTIDVGKIAMAEKGFECFQIVGFKDGKASFVSGPSMDEFAAKNGKPANQKKPVIYDGKKFKINKLDIMSNGDVFINGQEWANDLQSNVQGSSTPRYKDFHIFHFGADGELKKSYGIDNNQKTGLKGATDALSDPKYYPTEALVIEGKDPNDVYWVSMYIHNIEKRQWTEGNMEYTQWTPRQKLKAAQIDASSGSIGEMKVYGDERTYLFKKYPFVKINGGKQTIWLGENDKDNLIWLGKFDPAKL